jgi:SpoVK/Ycf46/Vps4 family AAA+-type ATPase
MLSRPEINSQLSRPEIESLAAATEGFSGSDMACLCRHAAMAPVRELLAAARGGERKRRRRLAAADDGNGGAEGPGGAGSGGGGGGGGGGGVGRGNAELASVRKLVAGDFEAALKTIRPAAGDAARRAG